MHRMRICLMSMLIIALSLGCADSFDPQLLSRIKPDTGNLVDSLYKPKATLYALPADAKLNFTNEIMGMVNWPKDYQEPKPCPYTDNDSQQIIAIGICYTKFALKGMEQNPGGMRIIGEFPLDKCLNPILNPAKEIWDGKKEGAVHTLKGKIQFYDYEFNSDAENPMVFQITPKGYKYLRGKGTVKDLKTGKTASLGN